MSIILFFFFKQKTAYEISACLVGSEMCIRDSLWPHAGSVSCSMCLDDLRSLLYSPAEAAE